MKEKIKVGVIGAGQRGKPIIQNAILEMKDVEVVIVCDFYEERIKEIQTYAREKHNLDIIGTQNYKDILAMKEIDAVVMLGSWRQHTQIAIESMRAGKYVGIEVGGAYDISECFQIVDTYEETGMPCMMLENCCYGRAELMALNMVKQGLFGEIVHCSGGYFHDLRGIDLSGKIEYHYRINEYKSRNCENYPTHELGPIAKILGINRGNKMLYLSSMASKAAGLEDYYRRNLDENDCLRKTKFLQGDIVSTNIKCLDGTTIQLTLDTTLPRPYYSRGFTVRGTRGMYSEERKTVFLDGMKEGIESNIDEFFDKYDHPLHAEYVELGEKEGHGGMDWLVFRAFFESVKRGINTPIDAYDTAAWMAITPLSEQSIAQGGALVDIPDFTRGKWLDREPIVEGKYCLDKICEDRETLIY